MFTSKEKAEILCGRYERTAKKGKRILQTTLINTTPRQTRIIASLLFGEGLEVIAKQRGPHQMLQIEKKRPRIRK